MQRSDHHDWASEAYVEEWVKQQQTEDRGRAERFQLMCDLFPFPPDAAVTILDVGTGYGPVSRVVLDRYPHATCIGQDSSEPMLKRARTLMARYGERFRTHASDLFAKDWLPEALGPFDAAVSSICLHNLQDFERIGEIYGEIRANLKPGGVFLNLDLINAPTPDVQRRYVAAATARRQREEVADTRLDAMVRHGESFAALGGVGPFPADLDQHLAALKAAGFEDVDCFWKELRRALFGGYA